MAQRKQIAWSQLRVGILVLVSLTIFAVLVFLMTGESFFARKYQLKTYMSNAGGLKVGDPVRLAGIDAGNVEEIRISGSHDPKKAVEVVMRVQRRYQDEIRADSEITLDAEGLLGQRFLNITRGSTHVAVIPNEGVVTMREGADIQEVVETSADVMVKLNRITARVDKIMAQVESGQGSLGKIIFDDSLYRKANLTVDQAQRLVTNVASGQGTIGKLLVDETMYESAQRSVAKMEGIIDDVKKGDGSLGKLLYDPAIYNNANNVIGRAEKVIAGIEQGRGSLGKFVNDDALYNRANSAVANIDKIGAGLARGEGTAGKLLYDQTLYTNANNFTQELRNLLADFRANPKKFLTIKLEIF